MNGNGARRVYEALTDTARFDAVTRLSAAGMRLGTKPTQIGAKAGDPFFLFGGYISGRHIELVPGKRLVFDHSAFPPGEAASLARGWKENYWEPLERYLASA